MRKELRQNLARVGPEERSRKSRIVLERLFSHPKFAVARTLLSYIAKDSEVETAPIFETARKEGKKVYAPRLNTDKKEFVIIEVKGAEKLIANQYGILEPPLDPKSIGNPEDLDLVIVPGLGFDKEGGRLGRGEGYFDQFLKKAAKAYKIGLAFDCQMIERVPRGPHDMVLNEVLVG
ncbi:MAG: 5-formyltetrahydrofolate cyclo-ligase [Candidatus Omnitrophica bacterium]|nr:5-formyltetrahydrofolate cyclo-ligase [Candidatus Omnitrophota bacterium]